MQIECVLRVEMKKLFEVNTERTEFEFIRNLAVRGEL
jgi:hypothetical protein